MLAFSTPFFIIVKGLVPSSMELNTTLMQSLALNFSPSAEQALQGLAEIERLLEVDSLAGATEAWAAAALERLAQLEHELACEKTLLHNSQNCVGALFRVTKSLEREISGDVSTSQDYTTLRSKQQALEEQLRSLTPSWQVDESHDQLVELATELERNELELRDVEERVGLLKDLPAQTDKARARLEAAQQELQVLEEEWTSRVTTMWTS